MLIALAFSASAADRFWVGGAGTWDASSTTHWSTTSGGSSGASVPGASDAAIFDSASYSGAYTVTISANTLPGSITVTNPASAPVYFVLSSAVTTGALSITGSAGTKRIFIASNTVGTSRALSASSVSISYADFRDIAATGAATWDLSATSSGDCGGNTGITFTTSQKNYWKHSTSSSYTWSDATRWFLATDGGGGAGRVPLPQDDVVFDHNSFPASGKSVAVDMPYLGRHVTFAGDGQGAVINTPTIDQGSYVFDVYGNLTLVSGMTISWTHYVYMRGRGTYYLDSGGKTFAKNIMVDIPTGTLNLLSDLTISNADPTASELNIYHGTFDANGYNVNAGGCGYNTGTYIHMRSGTWTLGYSGLGRANAFGTIYGETSLLKIDNSGTTGANFYGNGQTFNDVTIGGTGAYTTTFTGSNVFNKLTIDRSSAAKTLKFTAGTTTTVTTWDVPKSGTTLAYLISSTTTRAKLAKSGGGTVSCEYMNVDYMEGTSPNIWDMGATPNSVDGGHNVNILFTYSAGSYNSRLRGRVR
jgi:hypothetical protein